MAASWQLAPPLNINEYYEFRLYQMVPGRMPGFHDLIDRTARAAFARHGIAPALGFWESYSGPINPLYAYIIPWKNLDERMAAWKRFYADSEWEAGRVASYAGQQRVERTHIFIMRPSPAWQKFKTDETQPVGGVHEMRFYDLVNQDPNQAHTALAEIDLPFLQSQGARVLGVFSTWFGTNMNQAVTLLAWPDEPTFHRANAAYLAEPAIQAARDKERKMHGRPLVRSSSVQLMTPLPYGVPRANLAAA